MALTENVFSVMPKFEYVFIFKSSATCIITENKKKQQEGLRTEFFCNLSSIDYGGVLVPFLFFLAFQTLFFEIQR